VPEDTPGARTAAYFIHPGETVSGGGTATGCDLYLSWGRHALASALNVGLSVSPENLALQLHASLHGFYELRPRLPLVYGGIATPYGNHIQLGARFRPTDRIDGGLAVNVPVGRWILDGFEDQVWIQPTFDLRVAY
jgi:hypothetical protein